MLSLKRLPLLMLSVLLCLLWVPIELSVLLLRLLPEVHPVVVDDMCRVCEHVGLASVAFVELGLCVCAWSVCVVWYCCMLNRCGYDWYH